jgi:hypothetical protein
MRNPSWDAGVLEPKRICAAMRRRECHAYLFTDGFDNYNSATQMYETTSGIITYGTSFRRFAPPSGLPGQGVQLALTFGSGAFFRKNLIRTAQTLICKVSIFQLAPALSINGYSILGVYDAGLNQCALLVNNDGSLSVWRAWSNVAATLLASTGPGIIAPGLWYSVEAVFGIANVGGACSVWVNGFQVMAATGLNTQKTANAFAGQVQVSDSGSQGLYVDDFRVWDNTGGTQNAAIGIDTRLVTKMPSGAGANTNFTPNGAAANWQCVDDNPPDDDTTYVSGASAGLIDSYAMPSAGLTVAPVGGVVARSRVRKDDGATRSLQIGVQSASASNASGSAAVGSTYAFIDGCSPFDPNTTLVWTAAAADAAQHWKQETA